MSLISRKEKGWWKKTTDAYITKGFWFLIVCPLSGSLVSSTVFPLSTFFSLPHCKTLFISPCLLHVDMKNILGWNSNDSYIHRLSLRSVFVFKLQFSPNRVYKPCLGRRDLSLSYSLDSETLGSSFLQWRSCCLFIPFCGKLLMNLRKVEFFLCTKISGYWKKATWRVSEYLGIVEKSL